MHALLLCFLLVCLAACGGPGGADAAPRPNVVLFVVDTLRADSLGCYGNATVDTPAFDRLAREGVLYETAVAPSSWTRPSMASLLTSLAPAVHGAHGMHSVLPGSLELLSETFSAAGYATAFINTNPNAGSVFGFDQGFDHFVELYARREAGRVATSELITRSRKASRQAVKWMDTARKPFFLVVLTVDPHGPYAPPARFDRYGEGLVSEASGESTWLKRTDLTEDDRQRIWSLYLAEVAANDAAFGALLDHFDEAALADDTIVALTADHGEEFWEHGQHGHRKTLFDESLLVPLVLRAPGVLAAGTRVTQPVGTASLGATLLDLAGLQRPEYTADPLPTTVSPTEADAQYAQLRSDDGKHDLYALRVAQWKLVWDLRSDSKQLYDLRSDPAERSDVAGARADVLTQLDRRLRDRLREEAAAYLELHGDGPALRVEGGELPADVRETLEALGYVGK